MNKREGSMAAFAAGGSAGAIAGPAVSAVLVKTTGVEGLLLLSSAMLEKDVLKKIIRSRFVSQGLVRNTAHDARVTPEQDSQRVVVTMANAGHQFFVRVGQRDPFLSVPLRRPTQSAVKSTCGGGSDSNRLSPRKIQHFFVRRKQLAGFGRKNYKKSA
jgi:hypothetical protein